MVYLGQIDTQPKGSKLDVARLGQNTTTPVKSSVFYATVMLNLIAQLWHPRSTLRRKSPSVISAVSKGRVRTQVSARRGFNKGPR